jgi:dephospho-CoA kinase
MPFIIGLTGGIGSGKSSVAEIFHKLGAAIIDTDEIAHRLTAAGQPGVAVIRDQFGLDYLQADGALNRELMRALIFSDITARRKLEAILHPLIRTEIATLVKKISAPYVIIVVPLLIETSAYRDLVQRVLVIDCDEQTQIARALQRGGLTEDEVRAIIAAQANRTARLASADDIVHNDRDLIALHAEIAALHSKYLKLAQASINSTGNH